MAATKRFSEMMSLVAKVVVVHTTTYFIFGLVMSTLFDYERLFQQEIIKDYMRHVSSSFVLAGPFLQPIRGLLFALGIWPLRSLIFGRKRGWLVLWGIIIIFGILSTPAAAPSSIEGLIYSKLPLWYHLIGFPELLLQTLTFSLVLVSWVKRGTRQQAPSQITMKGKKMTDLAMSIITACCAWIGYAVGGIFIALLAGVEIDLEQASSSMRTQLMFVAAFIANTIAIYALARTWLNGKVSLPLLFIIFWMIDTSVPLAYQFVFLKVMPLPKALMLGLLPASIISLVLRLNQKSMLARQADTIVA